MAFRHTRDMKLKCRHLLAGTGFAALLCGASAVIAQPPSLGGADSFVILAGSRVTNTGPTHVTGSIGISSGPEISGDPVVLAAGGIFGNDNVTRRAQRDAAALYDSLAGRRCSDPSLTEFPEMLSSNR